MKQMSQPIHPRVVPPGYLNLKRYLKPSGKTKYFCSVCGSELFRLPTCIFNFPKSLLSDPAHMEQSHTLSVENNRQSFFILPVQQIKWTQQLIHNREFSLQITLPPVSCLQLALKSCQTCKAPIAFQPISQTDKLCVLFNSICNTPFSSLPSKHSVNSVSSTKSQLNSKANVTSHPRFISKPQDKSHKSAIVLCRTHFQPISRDFAKLVPDSNPPKYECTTSHPCRINTVVSYISSMDNKKPIKSPSTRSTTDHSSLMTSLLQHPPPSTQQQPIDDSESEDEYLPQF